MSEHEPLRPLSASQREALEEATASYQAAITADVARYLLARGIDRQTAVTSRLGVVTDPFPGHSKFRGMVSIPYLDRHGKPLTMRFRCLEDHEHRDFLHGKYNSIKDDPSRIYGVDSIHAAGDDIHLTEGEFDRLVLLQVGFHAAGFPGTQAWKAHHRRVLAGFNRIWVWGDPDDAGQEFVAKVTRALPRARGVRLRLGDVSETYQAGGKQALYDLVGAK